MSVEDEKTAWIFTILAIIIALIVLASCVR